MENSKIDSLRISQILCSKLCHDLISPVSAINNGLEFLDPDDREMFETSKTLISESGQQAINKLTFFRLALGAAGDRDSLGWGEVVKTAASYFRSEKIKIDHSVDLTTEGGELQKSLANILLYLLMLAADCLPRGGEIRLESSNLNELTDFKILVFGKGCALREDVRSGLDSHIPHEELSVRNVIGFLAVLNVENLGKELKIQELTGDQIEITIL